MLYFYLYIIPCIINAFYYTIPTNLDELKASSEYINRKEGEMLDSGFLTKLALAALILMSWYTCINLIGRELNIILHKLHTHQPYSKAREDYIRVRQAAYEAKKNKQQ